MTTAALRGTTFDTRAFAPYIKSSIPNQSSSSGAVISLSSAFYIAGGSAPTWSATNLPTGLLINASTGMITGTITGVTSSPQVTCTNSLGTIVSSFTWTVANSFVLPALQFNEGAGLQSIDLSQYYTLPSGETYTSMALVTGSLPLGVSLNSITHSLNYNGTSPAAAVTGLSFSVTSSVVSLSVTSFALTSTAGGTLLPFTIGQPFKQGDIPTGQYIYTNLANSQADIRNRWSDGSVKFAVISGRSTLVANTPLPITVSRSGTAPTGTNLTEANLIAAAPTASVALPPFGTVTLTSVLGQTATTAHTSLGLVRSILGVQMSEFHYRAPVGTDAHLSVWFFVRLYLGGEIEIETVVENGYFKVAAPADKSYTATITVNGTVRYTAALVHWYLTRWLTINWYNGSSGLTDAFRVTPTHDVAYLRSTLLVPNYAIQPTTTVLNGYQTTLTPLGSGNLPEGDLGAVGSAPHIGLMSQRNAAYIASGDVRAYKATLCDIHGMNSWPTFYRDENTQRSLALTLRPTMWTQNSGSGFDTPTYPASSACPNAFNSGTTGHAPSSFFPYMITGRWSYLETAAFWAAGWHMFFDPSRRGGTGAFSGGGSATRPFRQERQRAWHIRQVMGTAMMLPDSGPGANDTQVRADWISALNNTFQIVESIEVGPSEIGYVQDGFNPGAYGFLPTYVAPSFMMDFIVQAYGYAWDLRDILNSTAQASLMRCRDYFYKWICGLLGDGSNGPDFRQSIDYACAAGTVDVNGDIILAQTWQEAEDLNNALPPEYSHHYPPLNGNDIVSGHWPDASSYGGNMFPALVYAKDHGAPGAAAAWTRVTGASNYAAFVTNQATSVQWATVPR